MLASAANLSRLQSLNLARCQIGAEGARALAASLYLKNLTALDLSENRIEDGVQAILESPRLRQMTVLNLSGNGLRRDGVQWLLAAAPHFSRLTRLDLRGNSLGNPQPLIEHFGERVLV
jgi:Ran GTPase-activating protein (RanGAP) involved in mRNA processing and transport